MVMWVSPSVGPGGRGGFATDDSEGPRRSLLLKEAAPDAKKSLSGAATGGGRVLDEPTRAFLGDRAALIVGFVGADGRPRGRTRVGGSRSTTTG